MTEQQKNDPWRRSIKIQPKVASDDEKVELIELPWTDWASEFDHNFIKS